MQPGGGWTDLGAEHIGDRLRALTDAEQWYLLLDALGNPAMLVAKKGVLLFGEDVKRTAVHDAAGPRLVEHRHRVASAWSDRDGLEAAKEQIRVDAIVRRVVTVANDQDAVAHAYLS